MTHYTDEQLSGLIREDCVHRNVYTDPEIFDLEMERIWKKAWIYVGHDSQVKQPGDYFGSCAAATTVTYSTLTVH